MRLSSAVAVAFFSSGAGVLSTGSFLSTAAAAEPVGLSQDEFKMFQHYRLAMADERVQAMKPHARLPAIAKDAGFKVKELERVVEKGQAAGDLKAKCEGNLKEALESGALAGRVGRLELDASAAHAVAYVEWFNEDPVKLPIEACFAAARAAEACPIASTITLWAQDGGQKTSRVFEALISSASAQRIRVDRVADFAETRYMKLFEKVKNRALGDDFASSAPSAVSNP